MLLAAAALMAALSPTVAKKSLSNGSVSPRSGTTSTLFAFRVDSGKPAPGFVNARLTRGPTTVSIAMSAPASGPTWTRTARVASPGTWTVTFIGSDGTSAPGGVITVTVPTTPRPSPTVRPTNVAQPTRRPASPRPSPKATSTTGQSSKPSPTAKSGATPPATPVAVGGATQPSSPPGAGSSSDDAGRILPAVLLGLLVIVGVGGIALLTGRRQAEERPTPEPDGTGGPPDQPPPPEFVRRAAAVGAAEGAAEATRARPRAAWEVYSTLDNQPLGTVGELHPGESATGATAADGGPNAAATDSDGSQDAGGNEPGAPAEGS